MAMHDFDRLYDELPPRWNWSSMRSGNEPRIYMASPAGGEGPEVGPTRDLDALIDAAWAVEEERTEPRPAIEADSLSACPRCGASDWDEAQGSEPDVVRACCRQCFTVVEVDVSTMRFAGEQLALFPEPQTT